MNRDKRKITHISVLKKIVVRAMFDERHARGRIGWSYEVNPTRQPEKCGSLHINRVDQ